MSSPPARTWLAWAVLLLPPLAWFVHFNAVYGAASLGILIDGAAGPASRLAIAGLTVAVLALIAACFLLAPRLAPAAEPVRRFWIPTSRLLAAVSFIATLYQALPALLVP